MKKEYYSSSLVGAAESYLIDLFRGNLELVILGENDAQSVVISSAMHIAANTPWGGYPPPQGMWMHHTEPMQEEEKSEDDEVVASFDFNVTNRLAKELFTGMSGTVTEDDEDDK
jgi:hypothetical protein